MTSERQPDQTPTPRHPSCPLGRKRARPGDTPQPGETPDHLFASAGDEEHEFEEPRVDSLTHKKNGEPITLNEFAARNTSEDNASFRDIMEVGLEKKRQRYAWLYDKEDKAANAVKQQTTLALTDGSVSRSCCSLLLMLLLAFDVFLLTPFILGEGQSVVLFVIELR